MSNFRNNRSGGWRNSNFRQSSNTDSALAVIFEYLKKFYNSTIRKVVEELKFDSKKPLRLDGLEKTRKHRRNPWILVLTFLAMAIGLVLMFELSPHRANVVNASYGGDYGPMTFFWNHARSLLLGAIAFLAAGWVPLSFVYRNSGKILIAGYLLCILLGVMGWLGVPPAVCKLGACRWFEIGPISVQVSEILKIGLLISLAVFLGAKAKNGKINSFKETILPAGFLIVSMLILVAGFQKDLGTAISALAIVAFQFFVAGLNRRNITIAGVLFVAAFAVFVLIAPHRISRMTTFLGSDDCSNLSSGDKKEEYHVCHAKIAIGTGGLFGVGMGNSVQAAGYLPESVNDSIFAIIGEIFGFSGAVIVLVIFFALSKNLLKVANHMPNPASRILVAGACGWFVLHTAANVAAMTGLAPLTGITMPLISYGGTSIVFISAILGLVFNISAYTSQVEQSDFKEEKNENSRSRGRLGRTRYSGRGSF